MIFLIFILFKKWYWDIPTCI